MFGYTEKNDEKEKGFAENDRKALLFIFSFFLVIVVSCWGFMFWNHITRERDLTLDNYHDYINVYIDKDMYNRYEIEYSLVIEAKEAVSDFEIVVEVQMQPLTGGTQKMETFEIKRDRLHKDVEIKQFVTKGISLYNDYSINVVSISGRL